MFLPGRLRFKFYRKVRICIRGFVFQKRVSISMHRLAVALKLKKFRHRFGIAAPRVVVRSYVPWQWRAGIVLVCVLLFLMLSVTLIQRSEAGALGVELEGLKRSLQSQQEELDTLRSAAGTGQNAVSIERAAQQKLLAKIQALEAENASLKEDVRLFERLVPAAGEAGGVRVENFRVVAEGGGRYRFRLLMIFQPLRQVSEFKGRLQLHLDIVRNGRLESLMLPSGADDAASYQLEIKHLLRREGWFQLPEGAILRGVEGWIVQGDAVRARVTAQL